MTREDWMENFGEALQEILNKNGINQRELSDMTGISTSTISNYILGKSMVSGEAIVKIVYAINELAIIGGKQITFFDLLDFGDTID